MDSLKHAPLLTLTLDVDFAATIVIGDTPAGSRRIAPVVGGDFAGERLRGTVEPGSDWAIVRADGVLLIDVRLVLRTDDGVAIFMRYAGRFAAAPEAMARFRRGALLDAAEYSLVISAKFECGEPRYRWLNDVVAVGTGQQTLRGPVYAIFEIG